jgi:hypothetical protein
MVVRQRVLWALIAVFATTFALLLAERLGGPLARSVLGTPLGFHQHFTSRDALGQALLVQGMFLGSAFILLGALAQRRFNRLIYKDAVWVANPFTVGVGFVAYKWAYHSLHLADYQAEYDSPMIFAVFCLAAPVVFTMCFYAGTHLRRFHPQSGRRV